MSADGFVLEPYERLLWNLLSRRDLLHGKFSANKAKRLAVMAYCLYYRGVTVSQIILAKMSDSSDPSVVRATMSKQATSDIRCSVMPKSHIAGDVSGLAPVSDADAAKPYFVHQVTIGKTRQNVYELSEYGLRSSIYELLDLPAEFLSGVNRSHLDLLAKRYRKRKSLRLSDEAAHLIAVRDIGVYCYRMLNYKPFVYRTECRFFENGEFMSDSLPASQPTALASTAQISDGYIDFSPISHVGNENHSVYVEQDMGTQSRSYIRKNKLLHYLDFVRYSFRRHPALVTVLFSLQTRADFHYRNEESPTSDDDKKFRYAPSLRQEIIVRAYENFGDQWEDTLLMELRKRTAATMRACPSVRAHLSHELALFDSVLADHEYATISDLLSCIGAQCRTKQSETAGYDATDQFYYKTRRLEIYEESLRISGFKEVLLEGFSVMFVHNKTVAAQMPCLIPELSSLSVQQLSLRSLANERFCRLFTLLAGKPVEYLDYRPYVRSGERLFRNYYYNELLGMHAVVENMSDDLGGRARVMEYLNRPEFSLFHGFLVCLVEDDWLMPLNQSARCRRSDFLWPDIASSVYAGYLQDHAQGALGVRDRLSLQVVFVTYRAFLSGDITNHGVMGISVGSDGSELIDWRC